MIQKNYRLIRFMNKSRSPVTRAALGAAAWMGTILTTGSVRLAAQSWQDFAKGEIKVGFRRCGWYAKKSWMRLGIVNDPFFIFSDEVNHSTLDALERFIKRSKKRSSKVERYSDLLLVMAQRLHLKVENQDANGYLSTEVEQFYLRCNELLELLSRQIVDATNNTSPSKGREGDFSKQDAVLAFKDFASVLPLDSWPWFVESGTFLGLHREGGFLSHDYDVDVGIDAKQCDLKKLIQRFEAVSSFVVKKVDEHIRITRHPDGRYGMSKLPALVKLVHRTGINVDIFLHHCYEGYSWHGSSIHWWKNKEFHLERRFLEGIEVNAPLQADQYLTENYGDWRTPVTDFDCTSGTPNLTIAKNFLSIALFLKRYSVFQQNSSHDAMKVTQALSASGVIKEQGGRWVMQPYI